MSFYLCPQLSCTLPTVRQRSAGYQMSQYFRAYPLEDAQLIGSTNFEAVDDDEAVNIVRDLSAAKAYGVWCGERFVGTVSRGHVAIGAGRLMAPV